MGGFPAGSASRGINFLSNPNGSNKFLFGQRDTSTPMSRFNNSTLFGPGYSGVNRMESISKIQNFPSQNQVGQGMFMGTTSQKGFTLGGGGEGGQILQFKGVDNGPEESISRINSKLGNSVNEANLKKFMMQLQQDKKK